MIPISKAVLKEELDLASRILAKWQQKVEGPMPGTDLPANEEDIEFFTQEFCAELFLLSKKFESIAEIAMQSGL